MAHSIDPSFTPNDYPKPRVPVSPVVAWDTCVGRCASGFRTVVQAGSALEVTSGTAALALAIEHAMIRPGDNVLLPAFHCRSMIEPFLAAGAQPLYYRITEDLSVDFDDLQSKLSSNPRVLLVAHYFGFYQNMQKLRSWCDAHRVIMIEDCAHAFFGDVNGHPVGWYGDYAIASARKFFALADGGYLVSARHPLHGVTTEPGGFAFDIKSVLNAVESAFAYGRLAPLSYALTPVLTLQAHLWEKLKAWRDAGVAPSTGPGVSVGYQYLDLASIRKRMSVPSRWLLRLSARSAIVARRRTHYQRLATGLSGLSGARPLFPDLPDGVVPYMFPLLVEQPDSVFPALKRKGVPIWRWEHLEPGDCAVSRNYAYALFQLPCHQALRGPEIDWMIDTISEMLASVVRRCLP